MTALFPLRPLQQAALDGLRQSILAGKRRVVVQAPCGFGKTVVGAHMVAGGLAKRNRVAFVVPAIALVDQTVDRLVANGIEPGDIGVMQADHPLRRPHAPVQVCSVQTIDRRGFPDARFVIVDECHIRFAAIDRWISERPDVLFVGLSATPWSKRMGEVWDDLVIPTTLSELIAQGWLAPFRVFAAAKPDLSGVKIVAGEYHEGQLSEVMSGKQIVADVITTWLEKAEGRQTLLFAVDRAHAANLHEQFGAAGVGTAYIDGETPREERREILGRYSNGDVQVICSVGTMTTGVDVQCQCIVDAAPTKSEIRHVQKIGRGLRTEPGKTDLIVFDHAGNCLSLGLPTAIGRTTLRTGAGDAAEACRDSSGTEVALPRECRSCGLLMPAGVKVCAACGKEMRSRSSDVVTVEGELVELGTQAKVGKETAVERLRKLGKQTVYSMLVDCQGSKSDGWLSHKYKSIFGVWPRNVDRIAIRASPELRSWLHAERIRWAKSQASRRNALNASTEDTGGLAHAP